MSSQPLLEGEKKTKKKNAHIGALNGSVNNKPTHARNPTRALSFSLCLPRQAPLFTGSSTLMPNGVSKHTRDHMCRTVRDALGPLSLRRVKLKRPRNVPCLSFGHPNRPHRLLVITVKVMSREEGRTEEEERGETGREVFFQRAVRFRYDFDF